MNRTDIDADISPENKQLRSDGASENRQPNQFSSLRCPWDDWHPITDIDSRMADALTGRRAWA